MVALEESSWASASGSCKSSPLAQGEPPASRLPDVPDLTDLHSTDRLTLPSLDCTARFLATSIGLETFTDTNTCSVVWVVVAALIAALGAAMPKFSHIAWIGWLGLFSVVVSVVTLMGVVGSVRWPFGIGLGMRVCARLLTSLNWWQSDKPPLAPEGDYDRKLGTSWTTLGGSP